MAKLELYGFEDLDAAFARISDIPFEVTEDALDAMAEVAVEKIRSTGESMGVRDPESDVHILDKIKRLKAKKTQEGGYENITFEGSRTRDNTKTRNAEIAFVNEYGKRTQPARPFIRQALSAHEDEIYAPGEKIVGDWIEDEWSK